MKTYKLINLLCIFSVLVFLIGCEEENKDEPIEIIEFIDEAQSMQTNRDGKLNVKSQLESRGNTYDLTYEFKVVNQEGEPIDGIDITYGQVNGKSVIYLTDEQNRYASTFFIGTPEELKEYFQSSDQKSGPYHSDSDEKGTKSIESEDAIIAIAIAAVITLATVSVAQVGIILNAYKIDQFMLTDYVTETEDYILYCKTFDEIGELLEARSQISLSITSIFVTFGTFGLGSHTNTAIEIVSGTGNFIATNIRDELYHQAINEWGVGMDQVVGRQVAVKVFPVEEDAIFSNIGKIFQTYEIDYDNPVCSGTEECIKGTVRDASDNQPIEDALVKLSGNEVYSTDFTDNEGEYSFYNIEAGDYTVEVSKENYIGEEKQVSHDGSVSQVNFVLSEELETDEYRYVLTWSEYPEDLDIHLFTEEGDHIYFGNMGDEDSSPFIYLDRDDLTSYGPETITMKQLQASSIYVHNYSGANYDDLPISDSEAEVKVYKGNSMIQNFTVPETGTGPWWYVMDILNDGQIVEQDYLLDQLKKKISLPVKEEEMVVLLNDF